jgi:hypothetical protein
MSVPTLSVEDRRGACEAAPLSAFYSIYAGSSPVHASSPGEGEVKRRLLRTCAATSDFLRGLDNPPPAQDAVAVGYAQHPQMCR